MKTYLITGGAGFVGSNLALGLKRDHEGVRVIALDNLRRRGSELNLGRLREHGVEFVHGDVRCQDDLRALPRVDCLLECSAEPSVLAGYGNSPEYVLNTNLVGMLNCLELARACEADVVFLSTSRVYPHAKLNALAFEETETRYEWQDEQPIRGASAAGLTEDFPLDGPRSLYGATKLAGEIIMQEYLEMYGLRGVINRCGVITGSWQMGKVDQGVVVLWVARHVFGGALDYVGFGGSGKQTRDILHVDDLYDLIALQLRQLDSLSGSVFNVGGGRPVSVSLLELTALCREATGREIPLGQVEETRSADIRIYLSDCRNARQRTGWSPVRGPREIVEEIARWIADNRDDLEAVLAS